MEHAFLSAKEEDEDDEDVKQDKFVKIEPKEEDETENWEDLVPQPKTALSGRKKCKPLKWGKLQVSYPWRELPEDADHKTMTLRAEHLLEGVAAVSPQEDAVASQIDLDVSNTRLKQASEMVQDIIDEQLKKEDLLGDNGDKAIPRNKYRRCAYDLDSAGASSSTQEASAESGTGRVEVPKMPTYKDLSLKRWKTCSELSTALMILESSSQDPTWQTVYRSSAVQGNPHKRLLNQTLAKYGQEYPQSQEGENECVQPDLSIVPDEVKRVEASEIIFTIQVCDEKGRKQQEFDVLGSQTLHDLRDAFYFASDLEYDGPTRLESACMFIDGIFYSDLRSERSVDYAPELIKHLKDTNNSEITVREEKSRSMGIRLFDIERIPFGERCVYIHQGDIEHAMYFTGARKFNLACDCPFQESYPVLVFLRKFFKRYCCACFQNQATFVVHGSDRIPHDPGYFCYLCFMHFFADKDRNLLQPVHYQVFPYLHD
mmetsp:Transcript_33704/g.68996  ORF Transcript_33704/g.68996 Transcript_33704/m.68996 type:complete len:486 (+) Transcript_33704:55-1512(+)